MINPINSAVYKPYPFRTYDPRCVVFQWVMVADRIAVLSYRQKKRWQSIDCSSGDNLRI